MIIWGFRFRAQGVVLRIAVKEFLVAGRLAVLNAQAIMAVLLIETVCFRRTPHPVIVV